MSNDEDNPYDFEEWELPAELRDNEDFPALLEYCKRRAKQLPDDFEWLEKPVVLRMSQEIVDTCYELLKRKRKPRSVIELYMHFIMKGYVRFTEQDLLEALVKDGRFNQLFLLQIPYNTL
jgi:hypothetical protein